MFDQYSQFFSLPHTTLFLKHCIVHIDVVGSVAKAFVVAKYKGWVDGIIIPCSQKIFKAFLISLISHECFRSTTHTVRIVFQKFYLMSKFVWMPEVVMILDRDIIPLCMIKEKVESAIGSQFTSWINDADTRISQWHYFFSGIISRLIIMDEDFDVGICLIEARSERCKNTIWRVIGTDKDRYKGHRQSKKLKAIDYWVCCHWINHATPIIAALSTQ
jgi:hypothetical protein